MWLVIAAGFVTDVTMELPRVCTGSSKHPGEVHIMHH